MAFVEAKGAGEIASVIMAFSMLHDIPNYRTGHGRRETRTLTLQTPGGIAFAHAQQTVRITRTRTTVRSGKASRETAYLTVSLPADRQDWARREWLIKTGSIAG
jgi:hypothetical protein